MNKKKGQNSKEHLEIFNKHLTSVSYFFGQVTVDDQIYLTSVSFAQSSFAC